MRFVHYYLIGYFLLLLGALLTLWQGGVLAQVPAGWLLTGLVVSVGLGVMLALLAGRSEISE